MADEKEQLLKNVLGLSDTASIAIGGPMTIGGLIGALLTNYPSYNKVTKGVQAQVNAIPEISAKRNAEIEAGVNADLAKYGETAQAQAQQGLTARGITDQGVAKETQSRTASGLSGAYAAAHAALNRAKINAQTSLGSAMSNYQQNLAQRQYDSIMRDYAAKMGVWGSLGGLGTSILAAKSNPKEETQVDYQEYLPDIEKLGEPFRMQGVKDVKSDGIPELLRRRS